MIKDGLLVRQRYIDALISVSGDNGIVKVITGMRGVGKTTLMSQFVPAYTAKTKKFIINFDFDSTDCYDMKTVDDVRSNILKACDGEGKSIIVLHEIHKMAGWSRMISELVKLGVGEFFITASDDSVLMLKTEEGMLEKVLELRVTPLSLREFMELNNLRSPTRALDSYLKIGGFPMVRASMPIEMAYTILDGVFCSALLNDVLPYGQLPPEATVSMARHIMVGSGKMMDSNEIADASGSSYHTSSKILSSMVGCYMIFENEGRSVFNKLMRSKIVYYSADVGLRNCIKGYKAPRLSLGENVMLVELKRLGFKVNIEGDGASRVFEAEDEEGATEYALTLEPTEGATKGRKKSNRVIVTMDEVDQEDYTLSRFLLELAE